LYAPVIIIILKTFMGLLEAPVIAVVLYKDLGAYSSFHNGFSFTGA
jgi:hypothetical protein